MKIPFNWPHMTGKELYNIAESHFNGRLAGDGPFTKKCHDWLEVNGHTHRALLTNSCTASLEMSALLLDVKAGDEIIMPSYTFVSTANAFVLRGATPVFVDIRQDTLNLDETKIERAITNKTRAIVPVHYAGVGCEMDSILDTAGHYGLSVIEDAAQGLMATYKGKPLGSLGKLGAFSFHETKNIISGEGGALFVNDQALAEKAEIIREKGTNRSQFFRGEVDKYTWQEVGSSYLPGELIAAFLWAQLEDAEKITEARLRSWDYYHSLLADAESQGYLNRPIIPSECGHNAHLYYVILPEHIDRNRILFKMKTAGIGAVFHYVPLHSSPAGKKYGRVSGELRNTEVLSKQLIRLPLWVGLSKEQQETVVQVLLDALRSNINV
ncbi:dTDP-4-amino-4,6-dideoxygalactose transaminase [Alteromonas naphthalenivorans]|uniref:TDP-4-oxo-6-deoxy-D-glucose transaminase n=1 Tax=Alteromonas naphthalenivorans TaxID=715451 RepID=F5ZE81_ALTNA|nr:dTDP-4-amino-4,6-dideoxygalactose transaminase [Alteromonas naphthalenivorans]AEF04193.1 TDP-4-oxo-6-deoxy-D-glucose transaminase [Alteromonas naphthalenivorans]